MTPPLTHVTIETPRRFGGSDHRSFSVGPKPKSRAKKITHVLDKKYVHNLDYTDMETVLKTVSDLHKECGPDARWNIEREWDYGSESTVVYVEWWRPMTDEELALYAEQLAAHKKAWADSARLTEEHELQQLRAKHPEWLREDLR